MSQAAEKVCIKSVQGVDCSPLRSVENVPGTGRGSAGGRAGPGAGGRTTPLNSTRPSLCNNINNNNILKMNDSCHNNNITTNIRTEPFSDYYTVEEEVGRGKFAVVKRCRCKKNGKEYAAKFLRKRRKGKDCRSDVIHEISMLEMVRIHPRLVDLVEAFETSHELILVTEYASGGELYQHVVVEERIEEKEVRRLMRQVLDGLLFLHDRNTVHLDVKPQNVLLTDRLPHGDIKLCDLGFARKVYSGEDVRDIIGTPDYVAPEVLSYEPIHTASDMWSVGVLAYVMLTGYSPFAGETKQETFLNISQVNIDFPDDLFEDVTTTAQEFMMGLLVREPSERMTARDCLNHPWLQLDETTPAVVTLQTSSPFGSPIGQRRALTPPLSGSGSPGEEPLKKCRCDDDSDEDQRRDNKNKKTDGTAANAIVTLSKTTPHILGDNNNLSSPTSGSLPLTTTTPTKVYATRAEPVPLELLEAERKENRSENEKPKQLNCEDTKSRVYANDTSNCLPQGDIEQELVC